MERINQENNTTNAPESKRKSLIPQGFRPHLLAARLFLAALGAGGAACTLTPQAQESELVLNQFLQDREKICSLREKEEKSSILLQNGRVIYTRGSKYQGPSKEEVRHYYSDIMIGDYAGQPYSNPVGILVSDRMIGHPELLGDKYLIYITVESLDSSRKPLKEYLRITNMNDRLSSASKNITGYCK